MRVQRLNFLCNHFLKLVLGVPSQHEDAIPPMPRRFGSPEDSPPTVGARSRAGRAGQNLSLGGRIGRGTGASVPVPPICSSQPTVWPALCAGRCATVAPTVRGESLGAQINLLQANFIRVQCWDYFGPNSIILSSPRVFRGALRAGDEP